MLNVHIDVENGMENEENKNSYILSFLFMNSVILKRKTHRKMSETITGWNSINVLQL